MKDETFMQLALEEAEKGNTAVYPNPKVGCVVVDKGKIISQAYHEQFGGPHAEINALKQVQKKGITDLNEAIMYVTLEPCAHQGKTPPCVDAIIASGIRHVVVAMSDPNPLVNGKGIIALEHAGIQVIYGVMQKEAERLNRVYTTNIIKKRAYVTVKIAQSLDGCVLDNEKQSQWITGETARNHGNQLRAEVSAILVGVGTVLADNPRLTFRRVSEKTPNNSTPIRIIIDPALRSSADSTVFTDNVVKTIVVVDPKKTTNTARKIFDTRKNVEILEGNFQNGKLDIEHLLALFLERNIVHILVEGGLYTWKAFFDAHLVDECYVYIAPKLLGSTYHVYDNRDITLENALNLHDTAVTKLDDDVLVHGYIT